MRNFVLIFVVLIACMGIALAQTAGTEPASPPEENSPEETTPEVKAPKTEIDYAVNQKGDQFIQLSAFLDIPLTPQKLKIGGAGALSYSYFLTKGFSVGGGVSFAYSTTFGSNVFYFIPITVKATYQFAFGRFEMPLTLGIGGAFQNYMNRTYFGFTVKPEIGFFFRYSPTWSFGGLVGVHILPQWYNNPEYNSVGTILDVGLSVRYHF